ncbi:uncharacterized protein LOC142608824 [Castanea sativa]|uniref:uncharacterized protein LOC142608824 n=1 Tax=Castanea sativa TaxID=21020 RepID=UPI003F651988
MLDEEDKVRSMINHLQCSFHFGQFYYQNKITVTSKGLDIEQVKILTVFTSIDISANKLEGPIPETIGELKSLYVLNLSHNALMGKIPLSLGNLSQLESLDLSSNKITGEIPMQLCCEILKYSQVYELLGFRIGVIVVVAPLTFWEKGRKWHDDCIDKIILVIFPMLGLSYTGCYNAKAKKDEDIRDENTEDCEDHGDEDEMEDKYGLINPNGWEHLSLSFM